MKHTNNNMEQNDNPTIYEAFRQLATAVGADNAIPFINQLQDEPYEDARTIMRIQVGFKAWSMIKPDPPARGLRLDPKLWWGLLDDGWWRELYRDPNSHKAQTVARWIIKGIKSGRHQRPLFITN
jgi:hypothetical protein